MNLILLLLLSSSSYLTIQRINELDIQKRSTLYSLDIINEYLI